MSSNYFTIANARDKLINTFTLPANAKSTQTRNFTIGPLVSSPKWVKIALIASIGGSVKGSIAIDGMVTGLSTGNTFMAKIEFDTTTATRSFSATVFYTKGLDGIDFFASSTAGFDIAGYIDGTANLHLYAKAFASNMTAHFNCIFNIPTCSGITSYKPTDIVLSLANGATNLQLLIADTTIANISASYTMNSVAQRFVYDKDGNMLITGSNVIMTGGYSNEPVGMFLTGANASNNTLNIDLNNADLARRVTSRMGAGFRVTDANDMSMSNALFQWYYRSANQTTETQVGRMNLDGTMTIASNLGIGFASPSQIPDAKVHVTGVVSKNKSVLIAGSQPGISLSNTATGSQWNMWVASAVGQDLAANGTLMINDNAASAGAALAIAPSTGFVGIAKYNPAYNLDVNGIINASDIRIGGVPLSATSGGGFTLKPNGVAYTMSNVGIGTSNPNLAYLLDVAGDINFSGLLRKRGTEFISSQWSNDTGTNHLFITGSNIGIGTSNPQVPLHVSGLAQFDSNIYVNSTLQMRGVRLLPKNSNNAGLITNVVNPTQDYYVTLNTESNYFRWWGGGVEIARITGKGFFGIGSNASNVPNTLTVGGNGSFGASYANIAAPSNGLIVQGAIGINTASPMNNLSVAGTVAVGSAFAGISAPANGIIIQGNVGIGTTAPVAPLHVRSTGDTYVLVDGVGNAYLQIQSGTGGTFKTDLVQTGNSFTVTNGTGGVQLARNASSWAAASDHRLKTNISHLEYGLSHVVQLKPSRFDYLTDDNTIRNTIGCRIGFIAQDVLPIIPEAVTGSDDTKYGLAVTDLIPAMVNAIKELKAERDADAVRISVLEAQILLGLAAASRSAYAHAMPEYL